MKRAELEALIDRVRRPHNRRIGALLVAFFAVLVLGRILMPRGLTPAQMEGWSLAVFSLLVVVSVGGMVIALRAIRTDCHRFGVLCPQCKQHLYRHHHLLLGWGRGAQHRSLPALPDPAHRRILIA